MTEIEVPRSLTLSAEELRDLPHLIEEFSRTTADLVATHDALRSQVASLKQELDDKNRRLERKKRLEALGRVAAGVAHEFRNPLGGVRLTIDALLSSTDDDRSRTRLEHVRRAVDHLDHIVGDLLTFTHIEGIQRLPVSVRELVDHAVELACGGAGAPVIVGGAADALVYVDRPAFTQVIVNLVLNAVQAVGDRTEAVGIWWGERDGRAWFEVADDGPGIPPGEEEHIFHPFHSLRDGGTGLGLAIVHSRVEAHEGEISLVTDPWGGAPSWGGARFRIVLPGMKSNGSEA